VKGVMGVIEVRTGGDDIGFIEWEIEISWKLRREIHRQKAIEMYQAGDKFLFQVDTDKLLELLWPEAIKGWDRVTGAKGQGAMGNGATATATREEKFWSTPMIHLDRLAGQVADFLVTGREPGTATAEQDGQDEEEQQDGQDAKAPLGIV